jgi:hypothetical protein
VEAFFASDENCFGVTALIKCGFEVHGSFSFVLLVS